MLADTQQVVAASSARNPTAHTSSSISDSSKTHQIGISHVWHILMKARRPAIAGAMLLIGVLSAAN
jgi:hypothetical protein